MNILCKYLDIIRKFHAFDIFYKFLMIIIEV